MTMDVGSIVMSWIGGRTMQLYIAVNVVIYLLLSSFAFLQALKLSAYETSVLIVNIVVMVAITFIVVAYLYEGRRQSIHITLFIR
jgi:hypothetical protein